MSDEEVKIEKKENKGRKLSLKRPFEDDYTQLRKKK